MKGNQKCRTSGMPVLQVGIAALALCGCGSSSFARTAHTVGDTGSRLGASEIVLHSFGVEPADGKWPTGGLIMDGAGGLYGTTNGGGAQNHGTVFKMSPAGAESVLHSFGGSPTDGAWPNGPLIRDGAGNLYGTTVQGGFHNGGTVFKISPTGTETILLSFAGGPKDGMTPMAGLIRDSAGYLYGTTWSGGAHNHGTVFKISPSGREVILHSFAGGTNDGAAPMGCLIADEAGNVYGTTDGGGSYYRGAVFKVSPTGEETVLYSFEGGPSDGWGPMAGLIIDSGGNLYGTTSGGGPEHGGTVFEIGTNGTERVLHIFAGPTDGSTPWARLIMDQARILYGTTSGASTLFKIDLATGRETVLLDFDRPGGVGPMGRLLRDSAGNLYGTAIRGGSQNDGTVFKIQLK